MDGKNAGPDLSGRDITNDGADGSITKAESVSTPTPKRRGRLLRKSNTSTSTFAPSAPPTKVRPRTTTGKRATRKEKAAADPTSLENLDSRTVDVGNQDTMHDGSLLMGSTTTSNHAEGDINIQVSSSAA
jgi:FAD/FMN-containing dehydrogenase